MMRLGRREKILVSLAAAAILVFVLFQAIIFPFFDKRAVIRRGIDAKKDGLKEIVRLRSEFKSYKRGADGLQRHLKSRLKNFTLYSFLGEAAEKARVKGHITYMKPSAPRRNGQFKESMVEMKLDKINLRQLVDYLYLVESPENVVSIRRISIKDSKSVPGYLDAVMQVITIEN